MLDDISRAAVKVPELQLRSLLGCFLFSGDDVFKPLGVLSGGERNRFALARILVSPSNFLLLDEPTNHLDMRAKDVLLEAIAAFSGTIIFVSHDRYFIDRLATRVLEIEDGSVLAYEGNYEDYLRKKEALAAAGSTTGNGSGQASYQGTTSVVTKEEHKERGALAPAGSSPGCLSWQHLRHRRRLRTGRRRTRSTPPQPHQAKNRCRSVALISKKKSPASKPQSSTLSSNSEPTSPLVKRSASRPSPKACGRSWPRSLRSGKS